MSLTRSVIILAKLIICLVYLTGTHVRICRDDRSGQIVTVIIIQLMTKLILVDLNINDANIT